MTELYFSLVDIKHLLSFILKNKTAEQAVMLRIAKKEGAVSLSLADEPSPNCPTVREMGEPLEEDEGWEEDFPIDRRFFSLIQEADNWGHLVLALNDEEMNVYLEENGMKGCLN